GWLFDTTAEVLGDAVAGGCAGGGFVQSAGFVDDVQEIVLEILSRRIVLDFVRRNIEADDVEDLFERGARKSWCGDADGVGSGEQFVERTHRLDFAAIVNDDTVADVFDVREQVATEDDGFATTGEGEYQVSDFAAAERV